jgi:hypothetical protein
LGQGGLAEREASRLRRRAAREDDVRGADDGVVDEGTDGNGLARLHERLGAEADGGDGVGRRIEPAAGAGHVLPNGRDLFEVGAAGRGERHQRPAR